MKTSDFESTCLKKTASATRRGYSRILKQFDSWADTNFKLIPFYEIPPADIYAYVDSRSRWQPGEKHAARNEKPDFAPKGENVAEQINAALRWRFASQDPERNTINDLCIEHMNVISRNIQNFITGRRNKISALPTDADGGARDFLLPEEFKHLALLHLIYIYIYIYIYSLLLQY